eukprot:1735104-Pyramimonas_sp.AAC.1
MEDRDFLDCALIRRRDKHVVGSKAKDRGEEGSNSMWSAERKHKQHRNEGATPGYVALIVLEDYAPEVILSTYRSAPEMIWRRGSCDLPVGLS